MELHNLLDIYQLFKSVNTYKLLEVTQTSQSEIEKREFIKVLFDTKIKFKTDGQQITRITFTELKHLTFNDLQNHFISREAYSRWDNLYFYYLDEDSTGYGIEIPMIENKLKGKDRVTTLIFNKWK